MVLNRARCCVAIPLYNVGIYAILCQFAVIALVTGVLSFAAPYIVAVAIPSFGSYILGAACIILFAIQGWGFFGVFKEKPLSYRKYVIVNSIVLGLAFLLSLIWIILSAARHTAATTRCVQQFVTSTTDSATTASSDGSLIKIEDDSVDGYTLCSIFTWVQLGIMGGLWLALFLLQVYFAFITRVYGVEQREDHKRYESIFVEQRDSYIRQSMMWENGRASLDGPPNLSQTHGRTYSTVSKSSGLRNEMKYEDVGNHSDVDRSFSSIHFDDMPGSAGYQDSPLHLPASPVKTTFTPGHGYSNSRSKLAPERSHAALQQIQPNPYTYTNASTLRPRSEHVDKPIPPSHQHQLSATSADSSKRKSYRESTFLDDYYQ